MASLGGKVTGDLSPINVLAVTGPASMGTQLSRNSRVQSVAIDRIERIVPPEYQPKAGQGAPTQQRIQISPTGQATSASFQSLTPDPANNLPGLMWNLERINAPQAWNVTGGSSAVTVGVADTGLDYTHVELQNQVSSVVDFTGMEDPPICKTYYGTSDQDLAALNGVPADLDFNGHGSWIGGNIAAALNGTGINGIAPNIKLVSLKISQWCGSAYDSEILSAFLSAATRGIDVVSISFGGYLDRSDPQQDAIYNMYVLTVAYARARGTLIVAAAGNEHVRIGFGGIVLSRGNLTAPGTAAGDFVDLYGLYEVPGGIPGVIDVSSTGNVVNAPSATCPADSLANYGYEWCKPASDAHQPFGVGLTDQLAYYSNYGPRIDIAAPGGARKFNLPVWDRGGTPGWPWTGTNSYLGGSSTTDGYNAWETFSITSNYAYEIPCFTFTGFSEFSSGQCYAIIQGTSMATPHVSAVAALIASQFPNYRHNPWMITQILKSTATRVSGNTTPVLSATDTSAGDAGGPACSTGYCHLGGPAVPDNEAYGAGLVNALAAVRYSPFTRR